MTRLVTSAIGLFEVLTLLAPLVVLTRGASAEITLIGVGQVAGHATDKSGLTDTYTNADGETIPANQLGSFGSAIAYSGSGQRYYAPGWARLREGDAA